MKVDRGLFDHVIGRGLSADDDEIFGSAVANEASNDG